MVSRPLARVKRGRIRGARCLLLPALLGLAWSCERQLPTNRHDAITGVVQSQQVELGQLTIRPIPGRPELGENPTVQCLLSTDAEVYVNDQYSAPDAIQVGDTVEVIGHHDANSRTDRFLVCLVLITRPAPLPPAPDLLAPSSDSGAPVPAPQD